MRREQKRLDETKVGEGEENGRELLKGREGFEEEGKGSTEKEGENIAGKSTKCEISKE